MAAQLPHAELLMPTAGTQVTWKEGAPGQQPSFGPLTLCAKPAGTCMVREGQQSTREQCTQGTQLQDPH